MTAIVALLLKYLPYLITASQNIPQIVGFISGIREIFARTEAWTPEEEAAFDAETTALRSHPAWQKSPPDA